MIHLAIGSFEIDWGKNDVFTMHGVLFKSSDVTRVAYEYVGADRKIIIEMREGTARSLASVMHRLELLGYTLKSARHEFEALLISLDLEEPLVTFDMLAEALRCVNVEETAADSHEGYDFGESFGRRRKLKSVVKDIYGARYHLDEIMEFLHPYVILRLLAENPANLTRNVTWHFADVIAGGWVERDTVMRSLGAARKFLIVTEGSSDAKIFSHALEILRPDIADFFYFVDMEEGYPFTGTGNLHRFCQGLVSIRIENRVLIIYDNDAEGSARFAETSRLRLPPNMRVMQLPSHPSLATCACVGPEGVGTADINGCAAAIECYLDLGWRTSKPPIVRWTSYHSSGRYQGELVDKEVYTRHFLDLRYRQPEYDFMKLEAVLDEIIAQCVGIAETFRDGYPTPSSDR